MPDAGASSLVDDGTVPRSVLLVAHAASIHTSRWANGLVGRGLEVHLASLCDADGQAYDPRVQLHRLPGSIGRGYVTAAPALRRLVRHLRPDLVNGHYATGYGTLAGLALVGLDVPYLLNVWGSDVYAFPDRSPAHRRMVQLSLSRANVIGSTSHAMARRTAGLTTRPIEVTPFGIDTEVFCPGEGVRHDPSIVVIGTVKLLKPVYGIDVLMRAFVAARDQLASRGGPALELRIHGSGPGAQELSDLARELGIPQTMRGHVDHAGVPEALRELDVFVALSRQESFGAAILEAGACGIPVLVSDAEGPAEVTVDGGTGLVVPVDDVEAATAALVELATDPDLRTRLGSAARRHVVEHYSWRASLDAMLGAYGRTIEAHVTP